MTTAPSAISRPSSAAAWWEHLLAAGLLVGFAALLYFPLLFTDRVLASGDILLYVYPYRDYAAAALRQGQVPLWNPYIFLGAPFLANPQGEPCQLALEALEKIPADNSWSEERAGAAAEFVSQLSKGRPALQMALQASKTTDYLLSYVRQPELVEAA